MSRREKLFWLSVGFVFIVGFFCFIPAHYEICEVSEKTHEKECASYQLIPFLALKVPQILDRMGGVLTAVATIAIAWFTLSLRQATDRLWDAGERQLNFLKESSSAQSRDTQASLQIAQQAAVVAERSLIDIERALMVFSKISINMLGHRETSHIFGYRLILEIKNTGRTVARKFVGTANVVVWDGDLPENFNYPDRIPTTSATSAVGPEVVTIFPCDIAIQDVLAIQQGQKNGFIYGWVEYDDIFHATVKRRTEFCTKIEVVGNPLVQQERGSSAPFAFAAYGKYNSVDEDCLYKPGERPPVGGLPPITQPPPAPERPGPFNSPYHITFTSGS